MEAYTDFATALKIDYDDSVNEWMKEVESNVSEGRGRDYVERDNYRQSI